MTDPPLPEPSADELARLADLLARDGVWDEPARSLEDDLVAAIIDEAQAARAPTTGDDEIAPRRRRTGTAPEWVLAAAAAVVFVVAGVALLVTGDDGGTTFALAGTDAAPDAAAEVEVTATPAGLKLVLDVEGLPGAPDGFMYEAWVGDGTTVVSAGSFHLRGGDGPIELWAGVADPSYDRMWVTVEPLDGDLGPSGDTRLDGTIALDADG